MLRKWAVILCLLFTYIWILPAYASPVTAETLYQESKKIEVQIEKGTDPAQVKQQIERLADQYTKLSSDKTPQSIEGIQAISAELIGLKMQFASVQLPDRQLAWERVHRLTVGFESLAYPRTAKWRTIVKDMEKDVTGLLSVIPQKDLTTIRTYYKSLDQKQQEIELALELQITPHQLNLMRSVSRFLDQQLTSSTPQLDSVKEALLQYRSTLQKILQETTTSVSSKQKEATKLTSQSWWIAAVLIASSGYLLYRRLRTH